MWEKLKDLFRENMLSCVYKKHLGMECPGCGTQRAILKLMEGDFIGSFKMYPPLALMLITGGFLVLHLIFRFKRGAFVLQCLAVLTAFSMFLNYLYKVLI